ncbi:MAG: ubiquinol-cytochrome c reductase iron-sulfur subunit [Chloroflexota bacterium]
MSGSFGRRDFIKAATAAVGGVVGVALGLPAIVYLVDPALQSGAKEGWVPILKVADVPVGKLIPFSFTRVQVNGWERTSTNFGGYVLRKSEAPNDMIIMNSRCTHLGCTVNWKEDAQVFICPCHDAAFGREGEVLDGPPPRPLDRFEEFRVTDDGVIEIFFKAG